MGGFEWSCFERFKFLVSASWRRVGHIDFCRKGAAAEFDTIHRPDVFEKSTAGFGTTRPSDAVEKMLSLRCAAGPKTVKGAARAEAATARRIF